IEFQGVLPPGSGKLEWTWDARFGTNVLRVDSNAGEELYTAYLQAGQASDSIPLTGIAAKSGGTLFLEYLRTGFDHILPKGTDHILFVIGLFLLNARLSSLLWQISSFTLAHTLTLGLGVYGVVQIPAAIVEPLIAASIVYVCVENLFCDHLTRWRPLVVFLFGLLHGLGFAGVLREIGLAPDHFITGLIAFNLGVELGQLAVIAGCFLAVGIWFSNREWYRRLITLPASLAIALVGGYWFFDRVGIV
ncbi:MAG TPA: HupE/UreJ family protein, partial [Gammaproteobacteria bacterium]|nr:HupE/UreJ family protein [Gammaproteobacteria bacterium]